MKPTPIGWLARARSRALLRYGLPVVLVTAALTLTRLLTEEVGVQHYFVVLSAILLGSILGGRAAALAVSIGALGTLWSLHPFSPGSHLSGWGLVAFLAAAVLVAGTGTVVSGLAVDNARLLDRARTALRRRDDVLAIVSHDLGNPLNVISMSLANARRLARGVGAEEALHRPLETAQHAAHQMTRLIADLLDASAIEEGKLSVRRAEEDAAGILQDASAEMRPVAEGKGIELRLEVAPGLPAVSCDRDRVMQVLENLAANAIHATQAGAVTLRAWSADGELHFEVRDTGPGIPAEEIGSVFERYRRGRSAGYRGSGLGLYIARCIVEAHGASLRVETRVGVGTAFWFSLPAVGAGAGA